MKNSRSYPLDLEKSHNFVSSVHGLVDAAVTFLWTLPHLTSPYKGEEHSNGLPFHFSPREEIFCKPEEGFG